MQQTANEMFEGRIEFLLSIGEKNVRVSRDPRQELLGKFREMIEVIKEAEEGESEDEGGYEEGT